MEEEPSLEYWGGNPSVELINGTVYYYSTQQETSDDLSLCSTIVIPFVPSSIPPWELTTRLQLERVELMKVLRGSSQDAYVALLQFSGSTMPRFLSTIRQTQFSESDTPRFEAYVVNRISLTALSNSQDSRNDGREGSHSGRDAVAVLSRFAEPCYCAVCLELLSEKECDTARANQEPAPRKDRPTSGVEEKAELGVVRQKPISEEIINVLCGHTFHRRCLQLWCDASCPVCRFQQFPCVTTTCDTCESTYGVMMCLVCGFQGCGNRTRLNPSPFARLVEKKKRKKGKRTIRVEAEQLVLGHAAVHWKESRHHLFLCSDGQHIWDMSKDEVVIPANAEGEGTEGLKETCVAAQMQMILDSDMRLKEEVPAPDDSEVEGEDAEQLLEKRGNWDVDGTWRAKGDFFAVEDFNAVLMAHMDTCAAYFEDGRREVEENLSDELKALQETVSDLQIGLRVLQLEKRGMQEEIASLTSSWKGLQEALAEQNSLTVEPVRDQLQPVNNDSSKDAHLEKTLRDKKAYVSDLKQEVSDLRFHLNASSNLKEKALDQSMMIGKKEQRRGGR